MLLRLAEPNRGKGADTEARHRFALLGGVCKAPAEAVLLGGLHKEPSEAALLGGLRMEPAEDALLGGLRMEPADAEREPGALCTRLAGLGVEDAAGMQRPSLIGTKSEELASTSATEL